MSQPIHNGGAPVAYLPVHGQSGRVQIVLGRLSSTTHVEEFRGIPYGIVPGRWEHSLLRESLPSDVFDASEHGPKCPQPADGNNTEVYQAHLDFPIVAESEYECLNLWILRPNPAALLQAGYEPSTSRLPVFFYIHGGGFVFGAGSDPMWYPANMISYSLKLGKPFIAVLINYRLNIFGFGASSMHDQKIALKWVSRNIAAFGGNPDNVTICGQSAGACSVDTLVRDAQMNNAAPMFRRAIMQSGAFTSVSIGPRELEKCDNDWKILCKYFEIENLPDKESLDILQGKSAKELIQAGSKLGWRVWSLVVDNSTVSSLSTMKWHVDLDATRDRYEGQHTGKALQLLIGDTDTEGNPFIFAAIPKIRDYNQIRNLFAKAYHDEAEAEAALHAYNIAPESPKIDLVGSLTNFLTDAMFGVSVHSSYESLRTSTYDQTRYPTTTALYRVKFGNPFLGPLHGLSHHCVDLVYLFGAFEEHLVAQDVKDGEHAIVSNLALSKQIQSDWIDMINGNIDNNANDSVIVYGRNRSRTVQNLKDSEWIYLRKRFEILRKNREAMATIMNRLLSARLD